MVLFVLCVGRRRVSVPCQAAVNRGLRFIDCALDCALRPMSEILFGVGIGYEPQLGKP